MRRMSDQNTQDGIPDQPEQQNEMSAQQELAQAETGTPYVGEELRMRREQAGQSIADLAESLRIQKRYLEALEDGRVADLPGTVYALGFVRTYAEYFGLDGQAYVTRFKEETAGQRQRQEYVLPEPIQEARVPTAAIAMVGIVLAIGAVVVWYGLRTPDTGVAEAVPEVPAHLSSTAEQQPAASTPAAPAAPVPAQTAAPAETAAPAQPVASTAPAAADNAGNTVAAAPQAAAPEPAPAPTPTPTPAPAPVAAAPAAPPPAAVPAPVTAAPAEPVDNTPRLPQVYGSGGANARIVISVTDDVWMEVTDPEGNVVLSRTLRAGDVYRVPDREGLVFVTGNAGGLEIKVDGEVVPKLGGTGSVRSNVKLNPELLKQGRAWP